jgi:hypothetical protein
MKSLLNAAVFNAVWLAAVGGAARGWIWSGPAAAALAVVLQLALVPGRRRELGYILHVGLVGSVADTGLHALGVTSYPTSSAAWPYLIVPPWIAALWVTFATLPRFSLAWLRRRPVVAVVFGAVGGSLSYWTGMRLGAVAASDPLWSFGVLAVEYAISMPLGSGSAVWLRLRRAEVLRSMTRDERGEWFEFSRIEHTRKR